MQITETTIDAPSTAAGTAETADKFEQSLAQLCEAILDQEEVREAQVHIDEFLADAPARELWQNFEQLAGGLNQRQQSGEVITPTEAQEYEVLRNQVEANPTVLKFLEGKRAMAAVQQKVTQYVGMTLELGRVPDAEDLVSSGGGCCGGGCGC